MIMSERDPEVVRAFDAAGGRGKPRCVEVSVCWAKTEREAVKTATEVWPIAGLSGPLVTEFLIPAHFEAAAKMVTEKRIAESVVCGPDPERHVEAIRQHAEAGYTHICVHQIGPDQEGFLRLREGARAGRPAA